MLLSLLLSLTSSTFFSIGNPAAPEQILYAYLNAWQNDKCEEAALCVPSEGREGFCELMDVNNEWQDWLADGFEIELVSVKQESGIWPELHLAYSAIAEFSVTIHKEKLDEWYVVQIDNKWFVKQ